jgi:hypothetical protein
MLVAVRNAGAEVTVVDVALFGKAFQRYIHRHSLSGGLLIR